MDSDFGAFYEVAPTGGSTGYGAGTNTKGHIVRLSYSPFDSLTVSAKWFRTELINESPSGFLTPGTLEHKSRQMKSLPE